MITDVDMSVNEICNCIDDETARNFTRQILSLFLEKELTYKVKARDNTFRIYCYIKKSKEALIINTIGDKHGVFELQIRIKDRTTLDKLAGYSENVRKTIVNGKECLPCRSGQCGNEYRFSYDGKSYIKCQMLCDNFRFYNLSNEDAASVMDIITCEIFTGMPIRKKGNHII